MALQRSGVDRGHHALAGRTVGALGGIEHLAGRRPADGQVAAAIEGDALGRAAADRHDIDLGRAVIGGGERHPFAVRRGGGVGLLAGMRGQPRRLAASGRSTPQIALGGEQHGVAGQSGEAVIAVGGRGARDEKAPGDYAHES